MAHESLERLQEDLRTLQAATGLVFPYEPEHVRAAFVLAVSACAAAVLALLGRSFAPGLRVAAEVVLTFVPIAVYAHIRKISSPGEAQRARDVGGFTLLSVAIAAASVCLAVWLIRSQALKSEYAMLIIGAVFGTHCVTAAAKDRSLRSWYFAGIGTVAMPIVYLLTGLPLDFLVFSGIASGVVVQALVWRSQLRALGRWS